VILDLGGTVVSWCTVAAAQCQRQLALSVGNPIFAPLPLEITPLTNRQEIGTGDYVGDRKPKTKFGANPLTWGASGKMREI